MSTNKSTTVYPSEVIKPEVKDEPKKEVKVTPKVEPKEESKKLTVVEMLVKALAGHGHIFSVEEKEALGKDAPV